MKQFFTSLPDKYFMKALRSGGRNEIFFTLAGEFILNIYIFIRNGKIIQYVFLLTVVGSRTWLLNLFYEKLDWFTLLEENKKLNSWKTKTNDNDTARQAKRLTLSLQSGVSQSNKYNC